MNVHDFNWMNQSELKMEGDTCYVKSTPHSDMICSPVDGGIITNAPFLYREMEGDFLVGARVKPTFVSTYDAMGILVYADERHWLKTCFEVTDFNTRSIVTVATDTYSDESIAEDVKADAVYLQIMRKGNVFACHYYLANKQ